MTCLLLIWLVDKYTWISLLLKHASPISVQDFVNFLKMESVRALRHRNCFCINGQEREYRFDMFGPDRASTHRTPTVIGRSTYRKELDFKLAVHYTWSEDWNKVVKA